MNSEFIPSHKNGRVDTSIIFPILSYLLFSPIISITNVNKDKNTPAIPPLTKAKLVLHNFLL